MENDNKKNVSITISEDDLNTLWYWGKNYIRDLNNSLDHDNLSVMRMIFITEGLRISRDLFDRLTELKETIKKD